MSTNAVIENGKIVNAGFKESSAVAKETNATKETESKKNTSGMDKNTFMKLLVAQMKYQDPMQPTSNTEYIAQYAQFSQVESLDNMAKTMEMQRASQLAGQYVTLDNSEIKGEGATVTGKVDFVTYSGSKVFLNVDGSSYNAEKLISVNSAEYVTAKELVDTIAERMEKLPLIDTLEAKDTTEVNALYQMVKELTAYQKNFLGSGVETTLMNYKTKADELLQVQRAQEENGVPAKEESAKEELTEEQIDALLKEQEVEKA